MPRAALALRSPSASARRAVVSPASTSARAVWSLPSTGLKSKGLEARAYGVDVGKREDVHALFARIESDFAAPVAVLVNNAVWARFEPLAQIEPETVDRMFAVGVHGLIWTTQAAAPQMERRGGGSIVNLSSVSAFNPAKDSIAYSALKAGVVGLSRASAIELSARKIRVNVIAPGMIGTPASIAQFDEATIATRQAEMPAGRFGEPEEIAALGRVPCQRRRELHPGRRRNRGRRLDDPRQIGEHP